VAAVGIVAFAVADDANPGQDSFADLANVTTLPFPGYPETVTVPDYDDPPECRYPEDEREDPSLPPLSCRNTGAEPPPGAVPTVDPAEREPTPAAEDGSRIIDNAAFRYTVRVPDDWYSDMRPEGGTFALYDPAATAAHGNGSLPGGLILMFHAASYQPPLLPELGGPIEKNLANPNIKFGTIDGATWNEGPGEGLAHFVHAVFIRDGVLYQIDAYVAGGDRPRGTVDADLARAYDVIATVSPY
jgi:hypothetical protein